MAAPTRGGPVFPKLTVGAGDQAVSLRDWFAGQALVGMGTWSPCDVQDREDKANWAYEMADAMLRARSNG